MSDEVSHPDWYGGEDNPYEVIKVLRAWNLELAKGFAWGNLVKYTQRAGKKGSSEVSDRRKAEWYATELVSIEAELAGRAKKAPSEIPVVINGNGNYKLHVDWDKRTTRLEFVSGGGGGPYQAVGGGAGGAGGWHSGNYGTSNVVGVASGAGGGGSAYTGFSNYTINFHVADNIAYKGLPAGSTDRLHCITVSKDWTLDMACALILTSAAFKDNEEGTKLGIANGPYLTPLPGSMTVAKLLADYPNDQRWLVRRDL